ncbi:MAG: bifunctional UDP-N-acetylglucosamine diphosphorylase/glucosamine-1-phosphate N-acetyltransferase GlmU [Eubacteriales bacterium]|jgi:bifunctional UDP-N-acetylglucosamine pyrophosphorylase/glucosamine-1-phosphate N-acetyltransferase|nr:bifunctional UDP-N-acetylglucosamine diphosphorylase/glucosamine-1-phosphate N-acetyltransferase GlmU [Eubacteriales bacterium]
MYFALVFANCDEKQMNSSIPKVLHQIAYKSIGDWIFSSISAAASKAMVVHAGAEQVKEHFGDEISYIHQDGKSGIVSALTCAKDFLQSSEHVLIINSSTPLIQKDTIDAAFSYHKQSGSLATILALEEQESSEICFFNSKELVLSLESLDKSNFRPQSSLAHVVGQLFPKKESVGRYIVKNNMELFSINDRAQLALAEKFMREKIVASHMEKGVTFISPETAYISGDAVIGSDTIIMPNTIIKGCSKVGKGCCIGPNTTIDSSEIGNEVEIINSVVVQSQVGDSTHIGPFAYIRPGSKIGSKIKIGDFVEIKNSNIGDGTSISHLTYVGDADVGQNVNFGCGTVVVNYDGIKKYRSTIGDNAFIGCNTNLVSPVNVGKNTFIAAGSTITEDVPDKAFAIARSRQTVKTDWKRKS